jgi:uncharacterized protein (TIGR00661 family)
MKILYAIQGTGNGHISRARDIIPVLQKRGELDILVSGIESEVSLPYPIKYRFRGLSFIFGKNGGIDLLETFKKSSIRKLFADIQQLPVEEYDIVISDFEPVSAWACKLKNKLCAGLSHQSAVINIKSPHPKKIDPIGKIVLKRYAPVSFSFGFHFEEYDKNIFTPVIRTQIRQALPQQNDYYTVYLPAYSDRKIMDVLGKINNADWQVFSKRCEKKISRGNICFNPVDNDTFINSMIHSKGVLCGAGFETPAEALFLKKKLMVIPMKGQYEQQCNAAALKKMGVPVIKNLKKKRIERIEQWVNNDELVTVNYPCNTESVIDLLIHQYRITEKKKSKIGLNVDFSPKTLREKSLGKIISVLSRSST